MPDAQKWGIFLHFIAFILSMENAPFLKKCHFFQKKDKKSPVGTTAVPPHGQCGVARGPRRERTWAT